MFFLIKKEPGRPRAFQALDFERCVFLEPVHQAEPEPAGVGKASDPAPVSDIDIGYVCRIEGVEDVEDNMKSSVVCDFERFFDPEVEESEGWQPSWFCIFDDPVEPEW